MGYMKLGNKVSAEEFIDLNGYPIFEKIKPLVKSLDVKYIRWWTTDVVTTAEIHVNHRDAKHITIGTGSHYSNRVRVAVSLKRMALFESIYGKLERKNSQTYVKYDDEGFGMLQYIVRDWDDDNEYSNDLELTQYVDAISGNENLTEYEKKAIIKQRIGHSQFARKVKNRAMNVCQINPDIHRNLIASHIKPWVKSEEGEKTDPDNGLCLSPNFDVLFEFGNISFNDDGSIIISQLSSKELVAYGLTGSESIDIKSSKQKEYLAWHRENKTPK